MNQTEWHASPALLDRFASDPAGIDDVTASSIESHLVACAACRAKLAAAAPLDVAASWDAVADRIDRPRATALERMLEHLGIGGGTARLVGATPGLWLAGLATIAGLAVAAALVSRTAGVVGPYLVLAPLVPLVGVAATFAPAAEPAGECGVATPLYGVGLALRRATIVVATTFVLLALGALVVPGVGAESAAWVLPALALVFGSLALGTWWRVEICSAALGTAWVATTVSIRAIEGLRLPVVDTSLFGPGGQASALAVVLLAGTVLVIRSDCYATLEARS